LKQKSWLASPKKGCYKLPPPSSATIICEEFQMTRFPSMLLFSLLSVSLVASSGCRMCNTCYPLGGLMGKKGQECTCGNCPVTPRAGSIIDAPQAIVDGTDNGTEFVDPSTLPSGSDPGATATPEGTESSSPLPSSGS
jgi:hypothetical protein